MDECLNKLKNEMSEFETVEEYRRPLRDRNDLESNKSLLKKMK